MQLTYGHMVCVYQSGAKFRNIGGLTQKCGCLGDNAVFCSSNLVHVSNM